MDFPETSNEAIPSAGPSGSGRREMLLTMIAGLRGDAAEVLVYDCALSDDDAASVRSYLMARYGNPESSAAPEA